MNKSHIYVELSVADIDYFCDNTVNLDNTLANEIRDRLGAIVLGYVKSLPEKKRVYLSYYLKGVPIKEIAQDLEKDISTVHRAIWGDIYSASGLPKPGAVQQLQDFLNKDKEAQTLLKWLEEEENENYEQKD